MPPYGEDDDKHIFWHSSYLLFHCLPAWKKSPTHDTVCSSTGWDTLLLPWFGVCFFSGFKIFLVNPVLKIQFLIVTRTEYLQKDYSPMERTLFWSGGPGPYSRSALSFSSHVKWMPCHRAVGCSWVFFFSVVVELFFTYFFQWDGAYMSVSHSLFCAVNFPLCNWHQFHQCKRSHPWTTSKLSYFCRVLRAGLEIIFSVSWMRAVTSNTLQSVVFSLFLFFLFSLSWNLSPKFWLKNLLIETKAWYILIKYDKKFAATCYAGFS